MRPDGLTESLDIGIFLESQLACYTELLREQEYTVNGIQIKACDHSTIVGLLLW
jgi:hypothetical protein